ncbi:MAG TPA: cation transporter [Firmicutes bacterium]|nr:cation transporter [Bacillota bacterium]
MTKYTVKVDGMQCGMCEAHVNDTVRKAFPNVKKVSSSHTKKQTIIITEQAIDEQALTEAINQTGYTALSVSREPYEKKGFFSALRKK